MEIAKFNMAAFDLERMDDALKHAHNSLREARDNPTLNNLDGAFEDLKHAFIILKWAYQSNLRKTLVKKEKEINKSLENLSEASNGAITYKEAYAVIAMLLEFLDGIYEAKQMSGIGIPKNKYMGAEAKIKKAVEA